VWFGKKRRTKVEGSSSPKDKRTSAFLVSKSKIQKEKKRE